MGSSPNRFVWMLAAAAGLALGVYACTDSMSRKKGAPGEFCNGSDTQCREGLICDEGVCSYQNNARKVCQSVCDKFNRTCNAGVDKCLASCVETLTQCWASEVTQKYASCYNSEQMTCERIESTDKPYNLCYQQLELPQRRLQTCRRLRTLGLRCFRQSGIEDTTPVTDTLWNACRRTARTVRDTCWSRASNCVSAGENGSCGGMFQCANDVFYLRGDDKLPTTPPNNSGGGGGGGGDGGGGDGGGGADNPAPRPPSAD